jgi:GT2 family glycosyltransferase
MTVAYIVLSWNNEDLLGQCFDSIRAQTYPNKKVILVDNDSKDNSVAVTTENYPEVEILAQPQNWAFAKGNNIGVEHALQDTTVEYIVLLNSDACFDADWTDKVVAAAERKPRGATFQTITVDYFNHDIIDSTHIYISRHGQATQGSHRRPLPLGLDVAPQRVFGCNAAAMLVKRDFIEAQPFRDLLDETMFMYLEDVDLAARATVMGWENYVVPGSRAYHMGSASSSKKDPSFSLYMTFRNNTGLLIKNLPARLLIKMIIPVIRVDIHTVRHFLKIGKKRAARKVIEGRLASLRYIPIFIRKRKQLKPLRDIDENYLWTLMKRGF